MAAGVTALNLARRTRAGDLSLMQSSTSKHIFSPSRSQSRNSCTSLHSLLSELRWWHTRAFGFDSFLTMSASNSNPGSVSHDWNRP
eukprot:CAMPEP_0119199798 /NCGR_PEP_ID=MMETSP1316-20130426/23869_1 /TAXON_ID=41880 /ORGANISM="Pycnococcus provasolii, Strain RCC2336" /LENGTH=85 /DNA_ID=CAMNT_0007195817 /DNA_START=452 /DNA_END=709 /DNA_ORIENTATION=-